MSYWARKECLKAGTISLKCKAVLEKQSGVEKIHSRWTKRQNAKVRIVT